MPSDGTTRKTKESFYQGLKTEWSLFWDNILGDEESNENVEKDPFITGKIEKLSLIQLKEITKALSSDRKLLNQKLESISKELDLNSAKLESLRLVGGDFADTETRIHELTNKGHEYSEKLTTINERLKKARNLEKELKEV